MLVPASLKEKILNGGVNLGQEGVADTVQREDLLSTDSITVCTFLTGS